jgi:hypothetical protein
MKSIPTIISAGELSLILDISEATVKILAKTKQIPCVYIKRRIFFNVAAIINHLQSLEGGAA